MSALEHVLILMWSDGWRHTFDNNFALEFFESLQSSLLPTQLAPIQCCTCCTSIVAGDSNIDISEVIIAEKNCRICALLLRAVKHHCDDNEQNIQIVRGPGALKVGSKGPPILRLYSDSG